MASGPTANVDLELIESAKRKAAFKAVEDHFDSSFSYVGIGSGSTIRYGVEAIAAHLKANPPAKGHNIMFVPTGYQSNELVRRARLLPLPFDSLPDDVTLDVAFDGADEVDEELNCIKGGGACLFQEKLVAMRSKKFVCIADYRKNQKRLLTAWPSIPIEVAPFAEYEVLRALRLLGSPDPVTRLNADSKAGPLKTDQGFFIVDAPFPQLLTDGGEAAGTDGSGKNGIYSVERLARKIKMIIGVLEVGLFFGENGYEAQSRGKQGGQKPVAVYFGLENGETEKRTWDRPRTSITATLPSGFTTPKDTPRSMPHGTLPSSPAPSQNQLRTQLVNAILSRPDHAGRGYSFDERDNAGGIT
ncbi:ribose-5-phosphate isomerase rki1 [Elasticomyces elasticus]|nr:ribose-5-phosphate isomerase rki1 [Elasticomyces elasticus]